MRALLGAVLLVATACPSGPSGRVPPPAPPEPTPPPPFAPLGPIEPLAIPAEAALPDRGLVLGVGADRTPVAIRLAGAPRAVTTRVPYARTGAPATGGATRVQVRVAPETDGRPRVAVHEQSSSGLGDAWRPAAWRAARVAAAAVGKPTAAFRFDVETDGFVDGPAAAAALATAFIAAATGQDLADDVAIIGALGPDGSVAPVALIGPRVTGALAAGARRIGVPAGQTTTDSGDDLAALARERGGEIVEIGDIYQAVRLATGVDLPAPQPLDPADMALSPQTGAALAGRYDAWRTQLGLYWDAILAMRTRGGKLPQALLDMAAIAEALGARAETLHRDGAHEAAYYYAVRATVYAATASSLWRIVDQVRAGDVRSANITMGAAFAAEDPSTPALGAIGTAGPATIADHLARVSAFAVAIEARGLYDWGAHHMPAARQLVDDLSTMPAAELSTPTTAARVVSAAAVPVLALSLADARARVASDVLEIEAMPGARAFSFDSRPARSAAAAAASTAATELKYFEATVVHAIATELSLAESEVRGRLGVIDPGYVIVQGALRAGLPEANPVAMRLRDTWGATSDAWTAYTLAASQLAHGAAAGLVTSWYSLGAHRDYGVGRIDAVARKPALIALLSNADRCARRHARAASIAIGYVPIAAQRHYQRARALRAGSLSDQVAAVGALWASSLASQTALDLVTPSPAPQPGDTSPARDSSGRPPAPADKAPRPAT